MSMSPQRLSTKAAEREAKGLGPGQLMIGSRQAQAVQRSAAQRSQSREVI